MTFESGSAKKEIGVNSSQTLLKAAFLASALYASTPEAASAWDSKIDIPQEQIESVFEEIGLPSPEAFSSAYVTRLIPSKEGKYIIQIRAEHKDPFKTPSFDKFTEIAAVQSDIYQTIKEIASVKPFITYYAEGGGESFGKDVSNEKAFRDHFIESIDKYLQQNGDQIDVQDILDTAAKNYSALNGGSMYPKLKEQLAALLLDVLHDKHKTVSDADKEYVTSLMTYPEESPKDLWMYESGALRFAYYNGWVESVKGCEDTQLLSGISIDEGTPNEYVQEINKEREQHVVDCMANDLKTSSDSFVVTPFGGMHDFGKEIENTGTDIGYIVLTPKSYPKEYSNALLD